MLYSVSFLSFAALVATQGIIPTDIIDGSDCPLAGPAFPAPSRLSDSAPFRDAVQLLEAQLTSPDTGLESNNTAYAIAIFSSKENKTLYERYYTPSIDVGVPQIDQDSVFRLASVSKVFTVWTFLAALGDSRFNDPITRYVPELASDGNRPANGTVYDDIEDVMWEDVTLGDLASQAAGIARDGRWSRALIKRPCLSNCPMFSGIRRPECELSGGPASDARLSNPG